MSADKTKNKLTGLTGLTRSRPISPYDVAFGLI
jgi:hypothetical protein